MLSRQQNQQSLDQQTTLDTFVIHRNKLLEEFESLTESEGTIQLADISKMKPSESDKKLDILAKNLELMANSMNKIHLKLDAVNKIFSDERDGLEPRSGL